MFNRIRHYLKERFLFILMILTIMSIFYIVFYLYDIDLEAINYAMLLSAFFICIYFGLDFYHYYKYNKYLERLTHYTSFSIDDLPESSNLSDQNYQKIIETMNTTIQHLKTDYEKQDLEKMDYFTMWIHQIKTPIFALKLLDLSSKQLLQLTRIEQYVEMVMHYLKLKHISSDLRIKECDLNKIVDEIIKKNAIFFIQKKIKLNYKPFELNVLSDEKWISFVLEQILSNALKYTKSGSISIYVIDDILYIEDTGIGIKEEDLPRLYEKGFTGYNGRIDKKASGLGLYLCKQVLDSLNHSIKIQSIIKQGTTVSIDFHRDLYTLE